MTINNNQTNKNHQMMTAYGKNSGNTDLPAFIDDLFVHKLKPAIVFCEGQ